MEPIRIKATTDTPMVDCDPSGTISISGRSLTEDPLAFYKPLFSWVSELQANVITFNFKLEYMNTSCSKEIFNLLMIAKENTFKKSIVINWLCDSTDEDSFETAKEFESMLDIPFIIQQY